MSVLLSKIMTANVMTLSPELKASAAVKVLVEHHYSGAPVTDTDGNVIGVISWWDLIDKSCGDKTVADLMTPHVVAMKPGDTALSAAKLMVADDIHRVIVMDDGKMVGLVTAMSLLRALSNAPSSDVSSSDTPSSDD